MRSLTRLWKAAVSIERVGETAPVANDPHTMREDARVAYKAAIDLWNTSANQNWARFNAMLVANSILLAVTGQYVIDNKWQLAWQALLVLPASGILLCIVWAAALSRGMQYQNYFVEAARGLEKQYLTPNVRVVTEGRKQAEERMAGFGALRTQYAMYIVVWIFVVLHLVVGGVIVYRAFCA